MTPHEIEEIIARLRREEAEDNAWRRFRRRVTRVFRGLIIYLSVAGLVTFSLFILEEAFQTTMFGTWPAKEVGDWQTVADGIELMEGIVATMRAVNYSVGWIQPLAFIAYDAYADSAAYYIEGVRSEALARGPTAFIGKEVEFNLRPNSLVWIDEKPYARAGKIFVPADPNDWIRERRAKGLLIERNGKLFLEEKNNDRRRTP
jgi:hypothetical protein